MKKLRLIFVWHMHQPYYKDDITGQYTMPWVFLHAIKDYYELPWLVAKYPKIKAVFNLVPSLMIQLAEYSHESVNDKFLNAVRKQTTSLDGHDRVYLVENLFHSNLKTMIAPFQRYLELANKKAAFTNLGDFASFLSDQDLLDLEILFLLSWCGNAIRQESKLITSLMQKQQGFDEKEKSLLLAELFAFVGKIANYYKELQEKGVIEVFTTPFYHPILPLIIDKESAVEAYPPVVMPKKMADFSAHAPIHVSSAVRMYNDLFGKNPKGFWPSEGSVSTKALDMLSQHGVQYCAADEDVLFKTLNDGNRHNIYKKYHLEFGDRRFGMFFRDKQLSDLIGFTYSGWEEADAAKDFVGRLKSIYNDCGFETIVPIVLDGENAWEYYENNAYDFFCHLYEELSHQNWIECVTAEELFSQNVGIDVKLPHIKAGSWIYGTFSTWIGQHEKNKAWELLSITKEFLDTKYETLSDKDKAIVQKEMMIAEGSDWFWWYGDDHYTPLADQFDRLFRKHLINIYNTCGEIAPEEIATPIISKSKSPFITKPTAYITPTIDGINSGFFEWTGCGIVELGFEFTAMDSSGFSMKKLYYGFDEKYIYFSIHGDFYKMRDLDYSLGIQIVSNSKMNIKTPILSNLSDFKRHLANSDEIAYEASVDDLVEVRIAKEAIACEGLNTIDVCFELYKNNRQIERAPLYSMLELEINGDFSHEWYI